MATELEELVDFLSAPRLEVRKSSVAIVLGLTGSEEGIAMLASRKEKLVPALLHLLAGPEKGISKAAGEAHVNLSQNEDVREEMVLAGATERCMELLSLPLSHSSTVEKRPLVMLLANLTQLAVATHRLLQEEDSQQRGRFLSLLVRLFSRSVDDKPGAEDDYEHVGTILVNVTREESGRLLLLDPQRGLLRQILPQIDSRSLTRRQGVAGTVRNCCFEAESHLASLLLASQFLWPALLLPLAGVKEYKEADLAKMPPELATPLSFERQPESDAHVRREAADALCLIAMHEGGRRALWGVNAPRILQVGYEDEEDPTVMEAYERLGSLLIEDSMTHEETS